MAEREPGWLGRAATEAAVLDLLTNSSRGPTAGLAARGDADSVPLLEALARAHLDSHQLPEALDCTDAILHVAPGHAPAHFWRGLAQKLMGRWLGEADADDESSLIERLEGVEALTGGAVSYGETAGLRQLSRRRRVEPLDAVARAYAAGVTA